MRPWSTGSSLVNFLGHGEHEQPVGRPRCSTGSARSRPRWTPTTSSAAWSARPPSPRRVRDEPAGASWSSPVRATGSGNVEFLARTVDTPFFNLSEVVLRPGQGVDGHRAPGRGRLVAGAGRHPVGHRRRRRARVIEAGPARSCSSRRARLHALAQRWRQRRPVPQHPRAGRLRPADRMATAAHRRAPVGCARAASDRDILAEIDAGRIAWTRGSRRCCSRRRSTSGWTGSSGSSRTTATRTSTRPPTSPT